MSPGVNGTSRAAAPSEMLVVVCVEDAIAPALTGRAGAAYQSPPQPREQAIALVQLLLPGHNVERLDHVARLSCPLAGGRRTVTIRAA